MNTMIFLSCDLIFFLKVEKMSGLFHVSEGQLRQYMRHLNKKRSIRKAHKVRQENGSANREDDSYYRRKSSK